MTNELLEYQTGLGAVIYALLLRRGVFDAHIVFVCAQACANCLSKSDYSRICGHICAVVQVQLFAQYFRKKTAVFMRCNLVHAPCILHFDEEYSMKMAPLHWFVPLLNHNSKLSLHLDVMSLPFGI